MKSIRKKLIASILSVILLVTFLLAIATYYSVREEMDELYDGNIKQVAHVILDTKPEAGVTPKQKKEIEKLRGEEKYLTQIWRHNVLEYSSHPTVDFPVQATDGYGRAMFRGHTWRYYRLSQDGVTVQMAQDLKERHSVVIELYGFLLLPILLQLPIFAGLIWVMVGYGLKPLEHISNLIKNRNASFLEALPDADVPLEISYLVDALNDLLRRLKEALETQRQFTADAAHELRTPLSAVRLQLDILKRAESAEEKEEALETLEKGVVRSTRLVQQMLELARQEPENTEAAFSSVLLKSLIEEAVDQNQPIAKSKDIQITTHLPSGIQVPGNAPKLSIMIGNIINNAITYTKAGGQVVISLKRDQENIILDVADDGIGIAPEFRERVFDRFYRVTGTGVTGSGLGLSIVRSVADLHGAKIEILDGLNGHGITVRVTFFA
jgi:two-component system OmpR family sensor kinase